MTKRTCSAEDCDLAARHNGLCPKHYQRLRRRNIDKPRCSEDGCGLAAYARGLCSMHYQRALKAGVAPIVSPPRPPVVLGACAVDGCGRKAKSGTACYCQAHYYRYKKYGDPFADVPIKEYLATGSYLDALGYVILSGNRKEHRVVMEQMLGRPLQKFENVHHINGIRHDNRPENLELWTKAQPCGQRPEDLARWVVENYREYVEAALSGEVQMQLPT